MRNYKVSLNSDERDVFQALADPTRRAILALLRQPTDIPTVGRFATIMDPQGATLSLITYVKQN